MEKRTDKRYKKQKSEMKELLSKETLVTSFLLFDRIKKELEKLLKKNGQSRNQ